MDVQPGWYDAGAAGRQRWWDGRAWTDHERDVPPPAPGPVPPAPGWYETPGSGLLRWWEGRYWTGFRIKNGRAGSDGVTAEQPAMAWVLGGMFMLLGASQIMLSISGGTYFGAGIPLLALGVLWFVIAARTGALRRKPQPAGPPAFPDLVRPLPWEQEGPGAGWYPVTRTATRWWTGVRWTQYIATRYGVRPTLHARRALIATRVVVWAILGLALVGVIGGIAVMVAAPDDAALAFLGVGLLIFGVFFVLLWILMLFSLRMQTRLLSIPAAPPVALRLAQD